MICKTCGKPCKIYQDNYNRYYYDCEDDLKWEYIDDDNKFSIYRFMVGGDSGVIFMEDFNINCNGEFYHIKIPSDSIAYSTIKTNKLLMSRVGLNGSIIVEIIGRDKFNYFLCNLGGLIIDKKIENYYFWVNEEIND